IEELLEENIEIPLVISDQLMPGMKGDELLKQIHAIIPKTLKILLTGQADADAVGKAVNNANLYRYIAKPWEPTDFNLTVTEAVHSYFQEKELTEFYADLEKKVAKRTEELKQKNEFLGIAVHDLRNPLAAIRGYAEMIKGDYNETTLEGDTFDLADQIINSSQYMIELIEGLLEVNQIETGKMNLSLCVMDILPILQWLTDHYTELAKAKGITLQFQCIEKSYNILGNENSLRQVLDNLISNAVKYSPYGKSISVRLNEDDKWIRCEIQDEGPGLSDEDQQKLFLQFSRLTPQPTGNENSTGLGLFIVKKLVDSMRGKTCATVF
ncbi:hybrid sensor histidine kinase/response regulator, partial [Candidatus Marithioploca araucensis]|nr:hybrid sensor histidine kinase/response regulator [Candidatus Marithioploca araucensis]